MTANLVLYEKGAGNWRWLQQDHSSVELTIVLILHLQGVIVGRQWAECTAGIWYVVAPEAVRVIDPPWQMVAAGPGVMLVGQALADIVYALHNEFTLYHTQKLNVCAFNSLF